MNSTLQSILLFLVCSATHLAANAQRHQHNFAQSYIGIQGDYLSGNADAPSFGAARVVIGGTHFWYRADFYISFPVATAPFGDSEWQYSEGITTGGRYLPFGPGKKWPKPFVGVMWLTPRTRLGDDGPVMQRSRLGIDAGLSLVVRKSHTLEARVQYHHNAGMQYSTARESSTHILPPQWTFGVAFKKYFDFTAGNASPEFKAWENSALSTFEERGALSGWSIGAGLSVNVALGNNPFAERHPFLPNTVPVALGPDVSLGYYFHRMDAYIRTSYRTFGLGQDAFGYEWSLREHRVAIEGFKFLFDYKGFVPFVGPLIGATHQNVAESEADEPVVSASQQAVTAGLVFGWDIRPSKVEWFILRTNLRWSKALDQGNNNLSLPSTHLEINFIQIVVYPHRLANLKHVKP